MMHTHELKCRAKTSEKKQQKMEKVPPSRRDKLSPHRGKRNQRLIQPCRRLFLTHTHTIFDCYSEFLSLN